MSEGSPARIREQDRPRWSAADLLTAMRFPLAAAFPFASGTELRLAILLAAAGTDLLDGRVARRYGASRLGSVLDPVADKLFMATAFGVVAFSGRLAWYEVGAALIRDIVATIAFVVTAIRGKPTAIPARPGGKAVTIGQVLTIAAFLFDSSLVHPLAWATAGAGLYAIWDYTRVSRRERRRL